MNAHEPKSPAQIKCHSINRNAASSRGSPRNREKKRECWLCVNESVCADTDLGKLKPCKNIYYDRLAVGHYKKYFWLPNFALNPVVDPVNECALTKHWHLWNGLQTNLHNTVMSRVGGLHFCQLIHMLLSSNIHPVSVKPDPNLLTCCAFLARAK